MGHCKDCRFWDNLHGDGVNRSQTHGACQAVCDIQDTDGVEPLAVIAVFVNGGRGMVSGYLETGPTFGCMLFEAKEG